MGMFVVHKSTKDITIAATLEPRAKVKKNTLSVVLTTLAPAPSVVKKEMPFLKKEVKPIVKKPAKPVVKKMVKPVLKKPAIIPVEKQEVVKEVQKTEVAQESTKEEVQTPSTTAVTTPAEEKEAVQEQESAVLDAELKSEYMAGLYKILSQHKRYPRMAKRRHHEGVAHVHFRLLKNGKIESVSLVKACGHKSLDEAAIKLIKSIEAYKPIPDEVSRVAMNIKIPITYSLKENY
jgi:protein TonB